LLFKFLFILKTASPHHFLDLLYRMPGQEVVSGQALTANPNPGISATANAAASAGKAAINAAAVCSKQLKDIGAMIKRVADMVDKNAPRAAELAATAFQEAANTQTGQSLIQRGGYRASILAALPNSVIVGGARTYIRSAAKTLRKIGCQAEKIAKMLPGQVLNTAKNLNTMIKKNVTAKNVLKANKALQKVLASYNRGANTVNSAVGTNALPPATVVPLNAPKVVAAANAVSKNLVKVANNVKKNTIPASSAL